MVGSRPEWPRSAEYIALDFKVAVHDVFVPETAPGTPNKYASIEAVTDGRKKVLSQATVAELLTKARLRFTEEQALQLMAVIKAVYVVAQTTDELCLAYSRHKRGAQMAGTEATHDRIWTASVCTTTKIAVFADAPADYRQLLSRDQIVSWSS